MKKKFPLLPALTIAAAAVFCLSLDSTSAFGFANSKDGATELFRETGGEGEYKLVYDACPDDETVSTDCLTGGRLDCERVTCPGATSAK